MEGIVLKANINPQKVYFVKFVLEAIPHIAWLSVPMKGIILLHTSVENKEEVIKIIESIRQEIGFQGWIES